MSGRSTTVVRELVRERNRVEALLRSIEEQLAEIEMGELEKLLAIAEAEDRGNWPLAARLRGAHRGARPAVRRSAAGARVS